MERTLISYGLGDGAVINMEMRVSRNSDGAVINVAMRVNLAERPSTLQTVSHTLIHFDAIVFSHT